MSLWYSTFSSIHVKLINSYVFLQIETIRLKWNILKYFFNKNFLWLFNIQQKQIYYMRTCISFFPYHSLNKKTYKLCKKKRDFHNKSINIERTVVDNIHTYITKTSAFLLCILSIYIFRKEKKAHFSFVLFLVSKTKRMLKSVYCLQSLLKKKSDRKLK